MENNKFIEEGKKYIHPEKYNSWEEFCNNNPEEIVSSVIDVMRMLEENVDFSKIKKYMLDIDTNKIYYFRLMKIVCIYAKNGPEFYHKLCWQYMGKYEKRIVKKYSQLNKKLERGLKYDDAISELSNFKTMKLEIESPNEKYLGKILIDKNNSFEGLIDKNKYICGKFLEDGTITFANICFLTPTFHYLGVEENNKLKGIMREYSLDSQKIKESTPISIKTEIIPSHFVDEINFSYEIDKSKLIITTKESRKYNSFLENIDSITEESLSMMKNSKHKLVKSLNIENN